MSKDIELVDLPELVSFASLDSSTPAAQSDDSDLDSEEYTVQIDHAHIRVILPLLFRHRTELPPFPNDYIPLDADSTHYDTVSESDYSSEDPSQAHIPPF